MLFCQNGGPKDGVLKRESNYLQYPILARVHKLPRIVSILDEDFLFCLIAFICGRIFYKRLLSARLQRSY